MVYEMPLGWGHPPHQFNHLSLEVDEAPFDDARVRMAMKLVLDRQMVVDTVLLGNGIVSNDNPVVPNNPLA